MSLAADALQSGTMTINVDGDFGWEWKRLYRPENKIAYLLSQFSADEMIEPELGVDQTRRLRRRCDMADMILSTVEEATGLLIKVNVTTDYPGVDHESAGLGRELINNPDKLLDFIFSPHSYVQLGNDNSSPPAMVETDLGHRREMFPEHYTVKKFRGLKVEVDAQKYGKTASIHINRDQETHEINERFCPSFALRGMLKGFAVGSAEITLYKPRQFNSISIVDGRLSDGSDVWTSNDALVEMAKDGLHSLISALSEEAGDIRIPRDLDFKIKIENTENDRYSSPEPRIRLTGVMREKNIAHLKGALVEYRAFVEERDAAPTP